MVNRITVLGLLLVALGGCGCGCGDKDKNYLEKEIVIKGIPTKILIPIEEIEDIEAAKARYIAIEKARLKAYFDYERSKNVRLTKERN